MAVALPLVISVAVLAYAWPAARIAPRDLPVGIVGTSTASQGVVEGLAHGEPGAFDFRLYPDKASARAAIKERDIYGAFAVTPGSLTVLESTAASPTVAQLLDKTGVQLAARASRAAAERAAAAAHDASAHAKSPHAKSARTKTADAKDGKAAAAAGKPAPVKVKTADVVRISADDPRGVVFSASLLPMTICSIVIALVVVLALRLRPVVRALALVVVSGAAALGVYVIAQGYLGALPHDHLATWASLALTILAMSATTAGMVTLVGSGGLAPSAALMVFVGNPFAGSTSAPELLPGAAHVIGQWLPPGAGASLVRGTAYFDGSDSAGHVAVLVLWSLLGLTAVLFGHYAYPLERGPVTGESRTAGPKGPALDAPAPLVPPSVEEPSAPVGVGMRAHSHARHAAGA
ncbi:ABC transporter permease [Streptomyces sp. NPDC059224]|uniref:ABC transporter permease n=1 Tax=Streptomyces sp. NPDC059224 TaxID=3346775 RepID=UPI003675677C